MLDDVSVFVKVVDSGSFTDAAEQLELSRSVISKYVSRLEQRLGVRLLHRTTRRLSLTEAGQLFYQHSKAGLAQLDQAMELVSGLSEQPTGTIRLNVPMSFGVLHIAPLLAEFMGRYPQVQVDMHLDDRIVDMVDAGYDLSIRVASLADSSLVARKLAVVKHAVVAAPGYLRREGEPQLPEELINHNVLLYRYQESASEWTFDHADGRRVSVSVSGKLRINNSLAIREAVLAGSGIARMPLFVVQDDIQAGRLEALFEDSELLELGAWAVYPDRESLPAKVRALVDYLAEKLPDRM